VSLAFFQLVLLIFVILLLAGLAYFTGAGTWFGVAVVFALLMIFFYFPKLINLELVKPSLVVEGPVEQKHLEWETDEETEEGDRNFYKISCACTLVLLLIILGFLIVHLLD